MSNTPRSPGSWLFKVLVLFGALLGAYFLNVAIQSHLGEKARDATGLERLSLEAALEKATAEKKSVVAELSAVWCPTCRKLDQKVLSVPEVRAAINKYYVFAHIEYEGKAGEDFQERYNVTEFPVILLLNPDGSIKRRIEVTFDPAKFLRQLIP